jgi:Killing trait
VAIPTPVNGQITDTVSQTHVAVLANLYQVSAQSFAMMMQNAAGAQQQTAITAQAATTQGAALLYSTGAMSSAKLANSDVPDNLLSLLTALRATAT